MKSIEIISIPVTDQQVSKDFYQRLGFEVINESPMGPDQTWVQLALPGAPVSITLVTWFPKMPAGGIDGLVIKVDHMQNEIAALAEKGIQVGKVDQTPWGQFATVKDPDGNSLSLHQQ